MDMSKLASLLGKGGGAGLPSNDCLLEFKAGRMNFEGKKVVADKRRGNIKIVRDPQGIKQFQWTEAGSNNPFQNIMIFPGDAKFEKVKQSKDRVYMLEFHQSKHRHFYWMQEKEEEEDDVRCKKVHNIINGIDDDGDKNMESETPASTSVPARTGGPQTRAPPASQPPNPGTGQNYEDMLAQFLNNQNMSQMMQQMQQQKSGPDLSSIITSDSKNKVFEDEKACERLYEHCPDNQQDRSGLRENLHSPTLRHVFSSLHNAISHGQGHILLNQMGIDPNNPGEHAELVELFNSIAKGSSS
jgi:26S proteasome regulatory subunit N13